MNNINSKGGYPKYTPQCEPVSLFPGPRFWKANSSVITKGQVSSKGYDLYNAHPNDVAKVQEHYDQCPMPGYKIDTVETIFNPLLFTGFKSHISTLNLKKHYDIFQSGWSQDSNAKVRMEVYRLFHQLYEKDSEIPSVKFLPMWHGTKKQALEGICRLGYQSLSAKDSTDPGFFGKGIYTTHNAEYAFRVYAGTAGVLLYNWVAVYSPFPVLPHDVQRIRAKGNFENYDANFIPVVPRNPSNPNEQNYDPCSPGYKHKYIELVVFQTHAVHPAFVVTLKQKMQKEVASSSQTMHPYTQRGLQYFEAGQYSKAIEYFKEATKHDDARAYYMLGSMYRYGQGVTKDLERSEIYFRLSASHGYERANKALSDLKGEVLEGITKQMQQVKIGSSADSLYEQGLSHYNSGRHYDAVECFDQARQAGSVRANFMIAYCYFKGHGVHQRYEKTVYFLRIPIQNRLPEAYGLMGVCLISGYGCQKDRKSAIEHWTLGAYYGDKKSIQLLKQYQ